MPTLKVDGKTGTFDTHQRLVLAVEELGIHIGHRCGGHARCTTCRVEFIAGEPDTMTRAECGKLKEKGLLGQVRLSCQLTCSRDMEVKPVMTLENQSWTDTGPRPADTVMPEATWFPISELETP
jgi:ferredoxin